MSAVMKKHHTKLPSRHQTVLHLVYKGHTYNIPKSVAEKYQDKSKMVGRVLPEDVFDHIEKKFTKAGVLLRGTRHREGLTQVEMARKIKVTQADLSKMESGKRPIGKLIAKRIEKIFHVNYRYFL
ncbi:MAG: helix-turn-helix transcriptional regulator [Proteobacteria bacterium]|nr:helix-turn-helix transcriptional regulator [Pseudomonadota bacterium]